MSVARTQDEVSSSEFAEWVAYEQIEPSDPYRSDVRAALIACVFANAFRGKGQKPHDINDFIIKFNSDKNREYPGKDEVKTKLKTWLLSQKLMGKPKRKQ